MGHMPGALVLPAHAYSMLSPIHTTRNRLRDGGSHNMANGRKRLWFRGAMMMQGIDSLLHLSS